MNPTHIALPLELMNQLSAYLSKRPFNEVANFFKSIEASAKGIQLDLEEKAPTATIALASKSE